jgi:NAD(P)-dependent dehydrogenase (short-subunit alcohol dehydrogenase family)
MNEKIGEFDNRVVVIIGAAGGLGSVVSQQFSERGAKIVLVGRDAEKLEALGATLNISRGRWMPVEADLTNEESVQRLSSKVMSTFGHVDILINLVGGWIGGISLNEVKPEQVDLMINQHIWSTFFAAQAFVPLLVENKWGRVIVVSSPNAENPPPNGLPYSVAKAGQESLILTLAAELRGSGVTANILRVKTIDVNHEKENNPSSKNSSWTTPEEITNAIFFLCSDDARVVNGARIPLYGSP